MSQNASSGRSTGFLRRGFDRMVAGGERRARAELAPYLLACSDDQIRALGYTRDTIEAWAKRNGGL